MDRKTYMEKFSRAVRWRLPAQEAGEVLSDYEDMLSRRPAEDDGALLRDLGDPRQAARLLSEPKAYRRWMVAFGVLAFCLLWPEYLLLRVGFNRWPEREMVFFLLVAIMVSMIRFRPRRGEVKPPIPKGMLPMMAALSLGLPAAGWVLWVLATGAWESFPPGTYGPIAGRVLQLMGMAAAAAGLWGLVKARVSNYRWRALYILSVTVLVICALILALLTRMDLSIGVAPDWWVEYAVRWGTVAVIGLIGTGVALC